ncbi:dihydrofolate reductase family protein [Pedobacter frigoris]|uniref:Dihydrofolate reductase n=1 Tax=Pedobacter frigoris TaxID=2571272 RepID=A0A4V5P217_9SPHI|nr:dihydrofolate reductase family protein [Pedobacter frigoris]TKC06193.1 dihydrofolate reductase [Pedobacter frigoris]
MRKIIQIVHTSIDGFVAGPNGNLDWFENAGEHLEFVNELIKSSDSALFGRTTYEMFNDYWPIAKDDVNSSQAEVQFAKWYDSATKIMLSKSQESLNIENTIVISSDVPETIQKMKSGPGKDIIIFGSPAVGQLLTDLHLIDEYWIFINPVFFRSGVPLFSTPGKKKKLHLIETNTISNGEVALHYRI